MPVAKPTGTRRLNWGGYVQIKVAAGPRRWPFEHRVVYEAVHGPISPGWFIHHLNGDKTDNRPENLIAVSSNSAHHKEYHSRRPASHGAAVSHGLKGKPKSPEHAAKISAALRGKSKSPSHKAALSASLLTYFRGK